MIEIIYERVAGGNFPVKAYADDAGFDLVANSISLGFSSEKCSEKCTVDDTGCINHKPYLGSVHVGQVTKFLCGFKMALPTGWYADVRPRSGLGTKFRIIPANTPGTIDAGYRDEIAVVLMNLGNSPFEVFKGDKIAQMVILPVPEVRAIEGTLPASLRGTGGFGSTGR